jgi:tetratricopeptide (TPR) repeat protein
MDEKALDIQRRLAPGSLAVAATLSTLGNVSREQGELEAAAGYLREALDIQRKLAPRSLALAASLHGMGAVAAQRGELNEGADHFREALGIRQELAPDSLAVAATLNALGNVTRQLGDFALALEYSRHALAIQQRVAPQSLALAATLNNLAGVFYDQGDLTTALQYSRDALSIREKLAPGSLALARSLTNLGSLVREQGDLKAAEEYNRRAQSIHESLAPGSMAVATNLIHRGEIAGDEGDLRAATEFNLQALAIEQKTAPGSQEVAETLNNLGEVALRQGHLRASAKYYVDALAIEEKQAPESLATALSLNNLGNVAQEQGHLGTAANFTDKALEMRKRLAPESLAVAVSLMDLGSIAYERGDLAAAGKFDGEALQIRERLAPESLAVAESFNHLAVVARRSRDLAHAENLAQRAWRIVQRQSETVTGDEARQEFVSGTQEYADTLLGIQVARREYMPAFVTLEEGRARALARLLFERREMLSQASGDLWPRHREALAKFHRAEEKLSNAESLPMGSKDVEQERQKARNAYQQARDEVDELWAAIQKRESHAFPPVNVGEGAGVLASGEVFVAFSLQGDAAYVFALEGGSIEVRVQKLPFAPSTAQGQHARQAAQRHIKDPILYFLEESNTPPPSESEAAIRTMTSVARDGHELFNMLFPGEIGMLVRKSKRLIISPDGQLWQLPFAALVTDVDSQGKPDYLGGQAAITYAPSLALYSQIKKEAPELKHGVRPRALVVGDPDFGRPVRQDPTNSGPTRLWAGLYVGEERPFRVRATGRQAETIARMYGCSPLIGENATEADVRKQIEGVDVIHLATHAMLQRALPMSSGLLLTPPATEPAAGETDNDGALQAWEIFSQLKLRTEVVVLSACSTARGDIVRGEGVVGLTRALEYAGARSVVATQWSIVAGDSTIELMEEFHRLLRKGEAKDEALKSAMTSVRTKYPHPFYWAPFILLGDPDNSNLGRN